MYNIEFLPAKPVDSSLLSVLFKTVYIETYGLEGVTYEFANFIEQQFSVQKIESDIASNEHEVLVAYYKKNPVGVIQVEYNKACPLNNINAPEINKLYVLRNFFGKGIGQGLMQHAEKQIALKGYDKIWLWVLQSNTRANFFYQKQGFETIGTADFQMEVNKYTNNVMIKKI